MSLADSAFTAFEDLNGTLGFHMKRSKRQPPAKTHKIQGVYIHHFDTHTEVQPCPERVSRIVSELQDAIQSKRLTPDATRKLAGKCSFTATQLFGRVGRFASRTLYDHAFSRHDNLPNHAIPGLQALANILSLFLINIHPLPSPPPTPQKSLCIPYKLPLGFILTVNLYVTDDRPRPTPCVFQ